MQAVVGMRQWCAKATHWSGAALAASSGRALWLQAMVGFAIGAVGGFVVYRAPTPKGADVAMVPNPDAFVPLPQSVPARRPTLTAPDRTAPPVESMRLASNIGSRTLQAAPPPEDSPAVPERPTPTPEEIAGGLRLIRARTIGARGLRAYPGGNPQAFFNLGLHPGDLITAVNGMPVAGDDLASIQDLIRSGQISSVTVSRAGGSYQLNTAPSN
jgi:hypothetical protein